jgi:hypothetical protein
MFAYLRVILANILRILCPAAIALQIMLVGIADLEDNSAVSNCKVSEYGSRKRESRRSTLPFLSRRKKGAGGNANDIVVHDCGF